jgi:hypothetical protein
VDRETVDGHLTIFSGLDHVTWRRLGLIGAIQPQSMIPLSSDTVAFDWPFGPVTLTHSASRGSYHRRVHRQTDGGHNVREYRSSYGLDGGPDPALARGMIQQVLPIGLQEKNAQRPVR